MKLLSTFVVPGTKVQFPAGAAGITFPGIPA